MMCAKRPIDGKRAKVLPVLPETGLVHHSDRGIQYASRDCTDVLKEKKIEISMSRKGNPYDNATCESFMKTRAVWVNKISGGHCGPVVAGETKAAMAIERYEFKIRGSDVLLSILFKSAAECSGAGA
jgi:transposase InsO family protein